MITQECTIQLDRGEKYRKALDKVLQNEKPFLVPKNRELTLKFLEDAELGRTILKGQKKKIREGRLLRMLGLFRKMDQSWFQKPFDEVTEEDMTKFILDLERGVITTTKGKPYTSETQSTIKKFIRKYYKYLFGDNATYPKLVQFIDTSTKIPEIKAINKEQNDKLISSASKLTHKFAFAVLFDGGMRIQEFYNIKREDLRKEETGYKVRIRISKSRPRTINIPLYPAIIDMYLERYQPQDDDFLFTMKYDSLKRMMHRLGKQVLGKNIYPHLLRHSSATYYSKHVSRYQLCYRYGWSASSKMPDRYIDMNGLIDDEVLQKVHQAESVKVQKENEKLNDELSVMRAQLADLVKKQEEAERRAFVREKESDILHHLHESQLGSTDEELLKLIRSDQNILKAIRLIKENITYTTDGIHTKYA